MKPINTNNIIDTSYLTELAGKYYEPVRVNYKVDVSKFVEAENERKKDKSFEMVTMLKGFNGKSAEELVDLFNSNLQLGTTIYDNET